MRFFIHSHIVTPLGPGAVYKETSAFYIIHQSKMFYVSFFLYTKRFIKFWCPKLHSNSVALLSLFYLLFRNGLMKFFVRKFEFHRKFQYYNNVTLSR